MGKADKIKMNHVIVTNENNQTATNHIIKKMKKKIIQNHHHQNGKRNQAKPNCFIAIKYGNIWNQTILLDFHVLYLIEFLILLDLNKQRSECLNVRFLNLLKS